MDAVMSLLFNSPIGLLGQASVMIQEMFKGAVTATAAAGFVGLLSLFTIGFIIAMGLFIWARLAKKSHED